jgi:hypothetical protein
MVDLRVAALVAAALSLSAVSNAAGGCCPGAYTDCGCGPAVAEVLEPWEPAGETYVVNQGPLFSGPGHYLHRRVPDLPASGYPYVGFVYSGYPYGLQTSGLYARGFFSPFTGYPYAEPGRSLRARPRKTRD